MAQQLDRSPPTNVARSGSIPESGVVSGLTLFLLLMLAPRASVSPVFLPPKKPTLLNTTSIWKQWTESLYVGCATRNSYLFILFTLFPIRYDIMLDCWKEVPDERPTFDQLIVTLEQMMTTDTPYFDFEELDESEAYYNEAFSDSNETSGSLDTEL